MFINRWKKWLLALWIGILLGGLTQAFVLSHAHPSHKASFSPSTHATQAPTRRVIGEASWYGPGLWGRLTASGNRLGTRLHGCAMWHVPLGTVIKIIRGKYHSWCVVDDRGPAHWTGRIVDVLPTVKKELHMNDLADVTIFIPITKPLHSGT